jgi:hypothetical protein
MNGRLLVAASLMLAGLAPAAHAAPPSIAGETVVAVDGAAKMRVSIPRRALLSTDVAKSVRVSGGGRLVGVVLRENHDNGDVASFLRLPSQLGSEVWVWAPSGPTTGCVDPYPVVPYTDCTKAKSPAYYDLRRGTYTLYAFTDGGPATVTLRFANYAGSVTLAPSTPVAAGVKSLTTSVGAPVSWSGGAGITTDGPADVYTLAWWKQDASAVAEAGGCWYDDSEGVEAAGTYRWLPECPGGSSVSGGEIVNPLYGAWGPAKAGQHGLLGTTTVDHAGKYGLGAWTAAQNVRDGGGFAYWVGR